MRGLADALRTYSRYSHLLPRLHQALRQLQEAPRQQRDHKPVRRTLTLIDTLGADTVRRMVADCVAGMPQSAVARNYSVAQSSVWRCVKADRKIRQQIAACQPSA